jgi:hypothetical protein
VITDREITRQASESLVEGVKVARASKDYAQVEALLGLAEASFQLERMSPCPDPVVAASLAAITNDAAKAISLYELALSQSAKFPDQSTYTWRICLGTRLLEVGNSEAAMHHLELARADAVASADSDASREVDELVAGRSNKSLERTRDR